MTTKIKTPVEVRVRNLESSPTFESKIERLINRELLDNNLEEALFITLWRMEATKKNNSYLLSLNIEVDNDLIKLERSSSSQEYDFINHTEEPNRTYSNYLKREALELLEREVKGIFKHRNTNQ